QESTGPGTSSPCSFVAVRTYRRTSSTKSSDVCASAADPIRQCRARRSHAFVFVDVRLPVQRQRSSVFQYEHMRQQAGSTHTAFNRNIRGGLLLDSIATACSCISETASFWHCVTIRHNGFTSGLSTGPPKMSA